MHEEEKYLDSLYCIQEKIMKDAADFAKNPDNLQGKGLDYFDTLMHMAKNLRKEIWAEEGKYDDMFDEYSEGSQTEGRAIRTTPGLSYDGGSYRSMRGGSRRSYAGGGSMRGGNSGRRDSRGRFSSRGSSYNGSEDITGKLRERADRMSDHDERERMLRLIEWIEEDQQ